MSGEDMKFISMLAGEHCTTFVDLLTAAITADQQAAESLALDFQ